MVMRDLIRAVYRFRDATLVDVVDPKKAANNRSCPDNRANGPAASSVDK